MEIPKHRDGGDSSRPAAIYVRAPTIICIPGSLRVRTRFTVHYRVQVLATKWRIRADGSKARTLSSGNRAGRPRSSNTLIRRRRCCRISRRIQPRHWTNSTNFAWCARCASRRENPKRIYQCLSRKSQSGIGLLSIAAHGGAVRLGERFSRRAV